MNNSIKSSLYLSSLKAIKNNRAQRRYLSVIKTVVQVRRLVWPVLQVNIAEKQVNVAQ